MILVIFFICSVWNIEIIYKYLKNKIMWLKIKISIREYK